MKRAIIQQLTDTQVFTLRQLGWTISLQMEHSMSIRLNFSSSSSTVSSLPASPQTRHTAVWGRTGWRREKKKQRKDSAEDKGSASAHSRLFKQFFVTTKFNPHFFRRVKQSRAGTICCHGFQQPTPHMTQLRTQKILNPIWVMEKCKLTGIYIALFSSYRPLKALYTTSNSRPFTHTYRQIVLFYTSNTFSIIDTHKSLTGGNLEFSSQRSHGPNAQHQAICFSSQLPLSPLSHSNLKVIIM